MARQKKNFSTATTTGLEGAAKLFRAKTHYCQKHPSSPIRRIIGLLDF
jgi:hypothetical protein